MRRGEVGAISDRMSRTALLFTLAISTITAVACDEQTQPVDAAEWGAVQVPPCPPPPPPCECDDTSTGADEPDILGPVSRCPQHPACECGDTSTGADETSTSTGG